jgi:septal ring-binding cell division protein DamX
MRQRRFVLVSGWVVAGLAGAFALSLAGLAGCASSGAAQTQADEDFESLYKRREYTKAYQAASAAYATAEGSRKDRAALTAGLALAALEPPKEADAERWLRPLVQSPTNAVSGSASATLGMIAQRKARHTEAASLLTSAAEKLTGDDRARAALFAGDSYQALGQAAEAKRMYDLAGTSTGDRLLGIQISSRQSTLKPDSARPQGSFTLQLGSFADAGKARTTAGRLAGKASAAGLPGPRVVQTTGKDGKPMHAVRIGRFATRAEAQAAQNRLSGEQSLVMVAAGE